MKKCITCHEVKPNSEFGSHKRTKDGLRGECKDCAKKYAKTYRDLNRDKRTDAMRLYRAKKRKDDPKPTLSPEEKAERKRSLRRQRSRRYLATPRGKIENAIREGVRRGIIFGSKAGRKTFDLLGYTSEELRSHLESFFQPGMIWENYGRGGWHIDHKIPLSAHNYETPDNIDFKKAWSLSNLQPLWEKDNLKKWNRFDGGFQPSLKIS